MQKQLTALFILLFFVASVPLVAERESAPDPVFADVTARGEALYEYDEAALHATDAVRAQNPQSELVGRYIAKKSESGWTVAFGHLNDTRDKFVIGYKAFQGTTLKEFTVKRLDPPEQDTSFYRSAARAIDTALHDFQGERRPYNVAVLPALRDQLYVYVLPAQTKMGIYPIGGDVRYLVTADGGTIVEKHQMHRTIIENDPASLPKGATPAAGYHTHVLSDEPEDSDVFHVLTRQPPLPEFIGTTGKKLYKITPDGIIREGKL